MVSKQTVPRHFRFARHSQRRPNSVLTKNIVLRYNRIQMHSLMLSEADYSLLADFRYRIRLFLHFSEQAARTVKMEPQHHQLLLVLRAQPDSRAVIVALAERLQIQHNTAVELVDRLARRGLVRRTRSEDDRRCVIVEITARGNATLERLSQSHLEEIRRAGPSLVRSLNALIRRPHARR